MKRETWFMCGTFTSEGLAINAGANIVSNWSRRGEGHEVKRKIKVYSSFKTRKGGESPKMHKNVGLSESQNGCTQRTRDGSKSIVRDPESGSKLGGCVEVERGRVI